MSRQTVEAAHFSPDTQDFIRLLHQYGVQYMIVGGEAVIYHGLARLTGDVDFFYDSRAPNVQRLFDALLEFWDGDIPALESADELANPGLVLQFGRPPNRIDLLNRIDGVSFDTAWETRLTLSMAADETTTPLYYIAREALIANKEASGRPKDLDDLIYLRSDSGADST